MDMICNYYYYYYYYYSFLNITLVLLFIIILRVTYDIYKICYNIPLFNMSEYNNIEQIILIYY